MIDDPQTESVTSVVHMSEITWILKSYMKPSGPVPSVYCARVLCGCLHLLDGRLFSQPFAPDESYVYLGSASYAYLREHHPEYLSTSAAYKSSSFSDEEHRSILNTDIGVVCVCSMEGPTVEATCLLGYLHQIHPSRRYALADFYYALIRHLSGILTDAVHSKTVGAFAAMKGLRNYAKKHTGIPLWPTDYDQLLPRGLADSARGYADVISVCHGFSNISQNIYRWEDPLLRSSHFVIDPSYPIFSAVD